MGLFDIVGLAMFMYQKDVLKMEPDSMQLIMGLISIPWCIKPVFGYLIDQILFKIRYTKYLIIAIEVIRFIVFLILSNFQLNWIQFYIAIFINSCCTLFENIVCEYILVVSTKKENEERGNNNANHLPIFFGFRALGSLVGNFFGGRIIKYHSIRTTFSIASMLPMVNIFFAIFYSEKISQEQPAKKTFSHEIEVMKELLMQENVLLMITFVCLINLTPNFDIVFTFYMTDFLKFTTEDLANFSTVASISYVIGLYMYTVFMNKVKPRTFFISTNFILWIVNFSFLLVVTGLLRKWAWNEKSFCLLTQGVYSLISELNYMPILAIWCSVCPKNLEATSITLFTGLINLSTNLSNYFGSFFIWFFGVNKTNFDKIWLLVVLQNAYLFLAMLGVVFVEFPVPKFQKDPNEKALNETVD